MPEEGWLIDFVHAGLILVRLRYGAWSTVYKQAEERNSAWVAYDELDMPLAEGLSMTRGSTSRLCTNQTRRWLAEDFFSIVTGSRR
jgi:hypothetical protein